MGRQENRLTFSPLVPLLPSCPLIPLLTLFAPLRSIFPGLEQADLDPKVFFRVLADVSDEPLELVRGLVQVVVERAVVEELAGGAVSPIESRGHRGDIGGESVQAIVKLPLPDKGPERAFTAVDAIRHPGEVLGDASDGAAHLLVVDQSSD